MANLSGTTIRRRPHTYRLVPSNPATRQALQLDEEEEKKVTELQRIMLGGKES